jgi:hypothetical protein
MSGGAYKSPPNLFVADASRMRLLSTVSNCPASIMTMQAEDILVVGAGPAGLATSACLRREGLAHVVLEREAQIASAWHRHYDRLHLHTTKTYSGLPRSKAWTSPWWFAVLCMWSRGICLDAPSSTPPSCSRTYRWYCAMPLLCAR